MLAQVKENTDEKFTQLYSIYREPLFLFIRRSISDENTAMDLLQDVFLNFMNAFQLRTIPETAHCRSYLYRTTRNVLINHFKRHENRRVSLVPEYGDLEHRCHNALGQAHDDEIITRMSEEEAFAVLDDLLSSLPEEQRTILMLRHEKDMKLDEIADIYERSVSSISRLIQKSEHCLRDAARARGFQPDLLF